MYFGRIGLFYYVRKFNKIYILDKCGRTVESYSIHDIARSRLLWNRLPSVVKNHLVELGVRPTWSRSRQLRLPKPLYNAVKLCKYLAEALSFTGNLYRCYEYICKRLEDEGVPCEFGNIQHVADSVNNVLTMYMNLLKPE